ncbi:MAG: hypothetical protein HY922_10405 [Elusimicrobia bacterium]|nr:hypothetical protein [Elusimicrobiota bacterium]
MGAKGLAGAAAAGTLAGGGSGGGVPSWLIWGAGICLAVAILFYAGAWALRLAADFEEWKRNRRRERHYREAKEAYERLRRK